MRSAKKQLPVKKFDFEDHSFEIKMVSDEGGWRLKVFVDGKPTNTNGSVSHEVQQDATHYNIGNPHEVIANALADFIKGGS